MFSLIKHFYQAEGDAHIIQYLCSAILLSSHRIIFRKSFCSPVFCFHFMFLCLLFSVSHLLNVAPISFTFTANLTSSPLHPPITTHTHEPNNILPKQPLLCFLKNWPNSSFSTSPGHHMHQSQFYQHPGKLGSTSSGVSERHHYRILHPILHYRGQQGV